MNDLKIGDEVYYTDFLSKKIYKKKIIGIDLIDKTIRYALEDFFGYFNNSILFKKESQAIERINNWKNNE